MYILLYQELHEIYLYQAYLVWSRGLFFFFFFSFTARNTDQFPLIFQRPTHCKLAKLKMEGQDDYRTPHQNAPRVFPCSLMTPAL